MIILIASLSVFVAYFVANSIPALKDINKPVTIKTADAISSDVIEPDKTVFNKNAINPTVEVIIGDGASKSSDTTGSPTTQEPGQ